jgi:FKBP-type peptidyl-prolyl cis-trans isomerase
MSVTAVPLRPIKKGSVLKLWIGLAVLALAAGAMAWAGTSAYQYQTTASGLRYQVLKPGSGPHPTTSDVALIDYTGRLEDGKIFDSTKGKQPVPMPVGGSIPGFSEGLQLMSKGGTYRLRIPSQLAYGAEGAGGVIPPNATLDFEVTLHEFMPLAQLQGMMPGGSRQSPPPQ